jgi:hypothetical protein
MPNSSLGCQTLDSNACRVELGAGKIQQLWFRKHIALVVKSASRSFREGKTILSVLGFGKRLQPRRRAVSIDLGKGWQFHQITLRHGFERMASFAPGGEAACDHEGAKSLLSQ